MPCGCPTCKRVYPDGSRFCSEDARELTPFSLAGRLVNDCYQILGPVGKGGLGEVWLAEERVGGVSARRVALKVMSDAAIVVPGMFERFSREAFALMRVSHPNVVVIHAVDKDDEWGFPFIVMELVSGRSLRELIEDKEVLRHIGWTEACRLAADIGSALAAAHSATVLHRDLKPANVMVQMGVGGTLHPKVLDFGIAKVQELDGGDAFTTRGAVLGTPRYMSPEQVRGADFEERSDVYALGLILYELLAGRLPLDNHKTLEAGLASRIIERPPLPERDATGAKLPQEVRDLLGSLLLPEPSGRPDAATAVVALVGIAGSAPVAWSSPSSGSTRSTSGAATSSEPETGMVRMRAALAEVPTAIHAGAAGSVQTGGATELVPARTRPRRWLVAAVLVLAVSLGGVLALVVPRDGEPTKASPDVPEAAAPAEPARSVVEGEAPTPLPEARSEAAVEGPDVGAAPAQALVPAGAESAGGEAALPVVDVAHEPAPAGASAPGTAVAPPKGTAGASDAAGASPVAAKKDEKRGHGGTSGSASADNEPALPPAAATADAEPAGPPVPAAPSKAEPPAAVAAPSVREPVTPPTVAEPDPVPAAAPKGSKPGAFGSVRGKASSAFDEMDDDFAE